MEEKGRLSQKEQFYATLSALDDDEDEQPLDKGRLESQRLLKASRPPSTAPRLPEKPPPIFKTFSATITPRRVPEARQAHPPLERTLSESSPKHAPVRAKNKLSPIADSPPRVMSSPVRPSRTNLIPSMAKKPTLDELRRMPRPPGNGKVGKKAPKIKLAQERHRIFRDLVFFFFPNNDTNTARRMRIAKAIEYGATWVVDRCDYITHVIVDKDINFQELQKHLKLESLPQNVVIVNDTYPAGCLSYRAIVDPKLPQYRIDGHDMIEKNDLEEEGVLSSRAQSPQSPQLKPAAISVVAAQPATPLESDNSGNWQAQHADRGQENKSVEEETPSTSYRDALEDIITGAKSSQYLPLELEDEDSSPQASDFDDSDTGDERPKKAVKIRFDQHAGSSEQFQCMKKNDGKSNDGNPNARTIEVLTEMGNYYEQTKDEWRSRAYRKAISVLRKQTVKIVTKEEAAQLPCVGEHLAAKIEEIVWTNRLRRLENARLEPGDEALQSFLKIYGVGLSKASRWVMAGLRTLDDLKSHNVALSPTQQVGVARYADFNTRIPRDDVSRHAAVVRGALHAIDHAFTATVGGSYRRGAPDSGDIDILISHPHADLARLQAVVFDVVVPALTASGFLKVALASHHGSRRRASAAASGGNHGDSTKWHGASALPPRDGEKEEEVVWRRIDMLLVPAPQFGAALIYFTGNDIFNRSMRLLASRKGMRLNQRGLYKDVMRGRGREKITEGELVEGGDEKRIFELLGVPWRPPEHRIC